MRAAIARPSQKTPIRSDPAPIQWRYSTIARSCEEWQSLAFLAHVLRMRAHVREGPTKAPHFLPGDHCQPVQGVFVLPPCPREAHYRGQLLLCSFVRNAHQSIPTDSLYTSIKRLRAIKY